MLMISSSPRLVLQGRMECMLMVSSRLLLVVLSPPMKRVLINPSHLRLLLLWRRIERMLVFSSRLRLQYDSNWIECMYTTFYPPVFSTSRVRYNNGEGFSPVAAYQIKTRRFTTPRRVSPQPHRRKVCITYDVGSALDTVLPCRDCYAVAV